MSATITAPMAPVAAASLGVVMPNRMNPITMKKTTENGASFTVE